MTKIPEPVNNVDEIKFLIIIYLFFHKYFKYSDVVVEHSTDMDLIRIYKSIFAFSYPKFRETRFHSHP